MILWDGSEHDWLEGPGPRSCLMGAIDDATGEVLPGAHFTEQESTVGYLRVLRGILREKGIPHTELGFSSSRRFRSCAPEGVSWASNSRSLRAASCRFEAIWSMNKATNPSCGSSDEPVFGEHR